MNTSQNLTPLPTSQLTSEEEYKLNCQSFETFSNAKERSSRSPLCEILRNRKRSAESGVSNASD